MAKLKLYGSTFAKATVDIRLRKRFGGHVRRSLFLCGGGWLLGGLVIAAPLHADEASTPAVQTSTTSVTPPVVSTATPSAAPVAPPPPAPASLPGVMPKTPQSFLNEMTGTVLSVDTDAGTVRITVEGGFNVDFKYDNGTVITENSKPLTADALNYGDKVTIHYAGKDLEARQIERTSDAVNPIANP